MGKPENLNIVSSAILLFQLLGTLKEKREYKSVGQKVKKKGAWSASDRDGCLDSELVGQGRGTEIHRPNLEDDPWPPCLPIIRTPHPAMFHK